MIDNIENIALEHIRAIRADMAYMKEDVHEIKSRVNTLESGQTTIIQQLDIFLEWLPVSTFDTTDCWSE